LDDAIRGLGGEATLVPCDLKDFEALDRLGAALYERWGKLDIFIANAGLLGPLSPLSHVDPPKWDDVLAVNVTANWRLIRSLDLLLRSSDAGRAIFMTSGAAHRAEFKPYWGPYAVSKAALEALARTYAAETATTSKVKVMLVDPGPLRTRMRATAMPGEDPLTLKTPEDLAPLLLPLCSADWTETGKLYDFAQNRLASFQAPG
jgi:NAD(P)-dependent dehydrogenase (short-subunit alcohol dehydrogenase family)